MTTSEVLKKYSSIESDLLLEHVLHKPKEFLYTHPDKPLTLRQLKKFQALAARRKKGEPIAYLLEYKDFFGLRFAVTEDTLIPRPETEWVVEHIISQRPKAGTRILDVGTGSGCIAISLKKHLPKVTVTASDISKKALAVAKQNAKIRHTNINFITSDLLAELTNNHFDIIVANLPYVDKKWIKPSTDTKGLRYEPRSALFAKEGGLYAYRRLLEQIGRSKRQPQKIYLEFDQRQKTKLAKLVKKFLPRAHATFHKDLAHKWRYVEINQKPAK